jgi:hypothetical protein
MASIRRHLASLGLAVVLCQLSIQVLASAALCCQEPLAGGDRAKAHECCPAGSHAGKVCPMHANRAKQKGADPDCAAKPVVDLHDILMTLSGGGVIPSFVALAGPAGSEAAPLDSTPPRLIVTTVPPGPPPRA